ncbi:MAG: ABC transporter permease [Bacteroidetes bacterium]|nr:ABC transporter permease [Bacteroidota bacterium]
MRKRQPQYSIAQFIALRYLTSRHNRGFISFITLFATIGITLGVASLIITLSILDGFEKTIKENVVSFTSHMQLFAFQNQMLKDPDDIIHRVMAQFPDVMEMTPYLQREGMIRSEKGIEGVLIKGVDPQTDFSAAKQRLIEGVYDIDERKEGIQRIILGKRLAEKLEISIGSRVLVYGLGGSSLTLSQARIMQFEVVGFYETGMADYDASFVYIHLRNAQRLFQVGPSVSGYDILVNDVSKLDSLSMQIPEFLGYPYYAKSMYQMYRNLFMWIELQKKPIPIILGLIIIVATVNVVGTLLMMVMEKSRQIGVMKTLGMNRKTLVRLFIIQGVHIGVVGTVLGNIVAFVLCWLELQYKFFPLPSGIYFMTHVPIELSVWNFFLVSTIAIGMSFLASLIPSRVAAQLDPIKLLRFL